MTWELAAVTVAGMGALVALVWLCLPYLRSRSSTETRMAALEAANVALSDRVARCEQFAERTADVRLPRGMPRAV